MTWSEEDWAAGRCEAAVALDYQIPHAVPAGPMVAWPGMDQAAFDAKLTTMTNAQAAFVIAFEAFQKAEGDLHAKDAHMADVAVAALEEGRSQFTEGTTGREVIDSIPIEPSSQPPNQAVITVFTSPAPGQTHIVFSALHGTSFDVLHKGPGDTEFTKVADDIIETTFDTSGLSAATHDYKVIGQNTRGNGPESAVASITVA